MDAVQLNLRVQGGRAGPIRADLLVLPVAGSDVRDGLRKAGLSSATLVKRAQAADFKGRPEDAIVHDGDRGSVMLVGIDAEPTADAWRRVGSRARREAERRGAKRVAVYLGSAIAQREALAAVAEGFLLAGYRFDRYRRDRKASPVARLTLVGDKAPKPAEWKPALDAAANVAKLVFAARDLVNEPPSVATPSFIAKHAERLAVETRGLKVEVWSGHRLEREAMN